MHRVLCLIIALHWTTVIHAGDIQQHFVESEYQGGRQEIRVLLPDRYESGRAYRVLYVLPVEPGFQSRFGYGLGVLKKIDAHNKHELIVVQMGFEKEPWFGDHATDPKVRQESYLKDFVVPFVEEKYSTKGTPEGRLLLGFSKSGWGAFSLILRSPDFWGFAAAWDAPLLFEKFHFGMRAVYGTPEQLAKYRPNLLIPQQKKYFEGRPGLVLAGEKLWGKLRPTPNGGSHTVEAHRLLTLHGYPHVYDNTLAHPHRWEKSWVEPTLAALLKLANQQPTATERCP